MVIDDNTASSAVVAEVENLNDEQRSEWLKQPVSREIPDAQAPKAESQPAKESSEIVTESEPVKTAEKEPEKQIHPTEKRIKELLADKKRLEYERDEALKRVPKETEAAPKAKAEASSARPARPKMEDLAEDGKTPKYSTLEDWVEAVAEWKVGEHEAASAAKVKNEAEANSKKAFEDNWNGRVAEAAKKHPDIAEVIFDKDVQIIPNSIVSAWIMDSDIGPEVAYHLAKNPDELAAINKMPKPFQAIRELVKIEASLNGSAPAKSEAKAPEVPEKKVSSAPSPVAEVGGRGTAPGDEVAQAIKDMDEGAYIDRMNKKELKARRG